MTELPDGWANATFPEIADVLDSRRIPLNGKERATRRGPFPYYGANGLVDHIDGFLFEGPHVLLAEDGGHFDEPERGVAYVVDGQFWVNNHAHVLKPAADVDCGFLCAWLNATDWMPYVGGSTRAKLTQAGLGQPNVRVPPLAEQRRIVAKLDALTARTARARADLDRVPVLAEQQRRAVLRSAFSGALTKTWRPVEDLGHAGWLTTTLGEACDVQSGIALGKKRASGGLTLSRPYLRVANVQRGWLKLDQIKWMDVTDDEFRKLRLEPGDVLMNEGGDLDKLGRGWVWRGEVPDCIHQNHVFRLRLRDRAFPPEYVSHYANELGQGYFLDEGKQTTNLASISKSRVCAMPIMLPPREEAHEIVRRIDHAFAEIDRLVAEAAAARRLLDRLDQAILAKAFRGELVPQDPADEPASVLLDRIRAERAAAPGKPKRGRRSAAA